MSASNLRGVSADGDDDRWSVRCQRHEGGKPCTYSSYRKREELARQAASSHAWRDHPTTERPVVVNVLRNGRVYDKVTATPIPRPEDDPPPF